VAVVTAYDGLASAWNSGAGHVYRPLASALVAAAPVPLDGHLLLDVGSGTGAVAEAAAARGARVVTADRTVSMIAYQREQHRPGTAADAFALPFMGGAFDGALAGFLLNHLAPAPALAELARVVRPGGAVLASTWAGGRPDPVKVVIDAVIASRGWVPPAWYQAMKNEVEPISGSPGALAAAAEAVGLTEVAATVRREELGLRDTRAVVDYRLAMPHIAPWVATLDGPARVGLIRSALAAVAGEVTPLEPWRPEVIFLACRVPHPNR
jgi:ubiquinone/menaquinone biosynthesis C-methylase UbiE